MGVAYSRIAYRLWGETDPNLGEKFGGKNWNRCGQGPHELPNSFSSRQNTFRNSHSFEPKVSFLKMKRLDNVVKQSENKEIGDKSFQIK